MLPQMEPGYCERKNHFWWPSSAVPVFVSPMWSPIPAATTFDWHIVVSVYWGDITTNNKIGCQKLFSSILVLYELSLNYID